MNEETHKLNKDNSELDNKEVPSNNEKNKKNPVILYLTNPTRNIISTLCLSYIWCGSSMIYYGMTFGKIIFLFQKVYQLIFLLLIDK